MTASNKAKILIITGLPLTGKSTYIRNNFDSASNYYVVDYAEKFLQLYGSFLDINDAAKAKIIYQQIKEEFMEIAANTDLTLVTEFCTGFQASGLKLERLIDRLELNNWGVSVKQMPTGLKVHLHQQMAENDPFYCPSMVLNDHQYHIITSILEDFK